MMILFWRIRYIDTRDRQFKDRDLWLDTDMLDAVTKAAVEASLEMKRSGDPSRLRKYRSLFKPEITPGEMQRRVRESGRTNSFCISDYHEDENENVLTRSQLAHAITGSESAVLLPPGAKQHDIDFMFGENPPIEVDKITLTPDQANILGIFAKDLKELQSSTLFCEGPGTLSSSPSPGTATEYILHTAVSDEEIRSFVTIFRRLYMQREPANLQKAAEVFAAALAGHPIADWVAAQAKEVADSLSSPPSFMPCNGQTKPSFTVKRLIDVFLYTQYAHQQDKDRTKQFHECLKELNNDRTLLMYTFLSEIWKIAINMSNLGQHLVQLYSVCSASNGVSSDAVPSARDIHPGIGALEKANEREDRILRENAATLAKSLWRNAGEPPGGPDAFFQAALTQLRDALE